MAEVVDPSRRTQVRALVAAIVVVAGGMGLFALGEALERSVWRDVLEGSGNLLAVAGTCLGFFAGVHSILYTRRGGPGHDAYVAFEAAGLPGLIAGLFLLEWRGLPDLNQLAPDWVLVPQAAFLAAVMAVVWLPFFAWRLGRDVPHREPPEAADPCLVETTEAAPIRSPAERERA